MKANIDVLYLRHEDWLMLFFFFFFFFDFDFDFDFIVER